VNISWRVGVCVTLVAAALRSGPLGQVVMSGPVWFALQFGPVVILALAQIPHLLTRSWWRPRSKLLVIAAISLVALALISAIWAPRPFETLGQAGLLAAVMVFVLGTFARWSSTDSLSGDITTLYWCGVAISAVGVLGGLFGQMWAVWPTMRWVGVFANPNYTGMSAAVTLALAFVVRGHWARIATVFPFLALLLSSSRGSMLGFTVGVVLLFVTSAAARKSRSDQVFGGVTVLGLASLFWLAPTIVSRLALLWIRQDQVPGSWIDPSSPSTGPGEALPQPYDASSGRLDIYRAVLEQWTRVPVLGVGYRASSVAQVAQGVEAHNIYLTVLVELGVVGAVVFVGLLVGLWRCAARGAALICAAGTVLASEFFESTLFGLGGPTSILFWLVLFAWAASGARERSVLGSRDRDDVGLAQGSP
jgi:O-antigen ligase